MARIPGWAVGVLAGAAITLSAPAASALPQGCWGKLSAPLLSGGYVDGAIRGLDCSDYYSLNVEYVGRTNGPRKYRIYSALRVLKSPAGGPGHGNQQVLIFDDRMKYLGVYRVISADNPRLWITGATVYFHLPRGIGNFIRLNGRKPPPVVLINGEEIQFWG